MLLVRFITAQILFFAVELEARSYTIGLHSFVSLSGGLLNSLFTGRSMTAELFYD